MEIVGLDNGLLFPRLLVYGRREIAMYLRLRNERRCAYRLTDAKSFCVSLLCTNWCCFGAPYIVSVLALGNEFALVDDYMCGGCELHQRMLHTLTFVLVPTVVRCYGIQLIATSHLSSKG